jgi:pyruvate-ferredoxin/flavodoxin oxidoreductase
LEGNPGFGEDWPSYTIKYQQDDQEEALEVPMTFADFAVTEARFRKHFRKAPPETWHDDMIPIAEFIDLEEDEREGKYPYVWGVDAKNRLMRVMVSEELVRSTEERRRYWRQLKSLAGQYKVVDIEALVNRTKAEMAQKLTTSLLAMASGGSLGALADMPQLGAGVGAAGGAAAGAAAPADYEPVWIETPECSACDECINLNGKIFAYNEDKKAVVVDPKGGPYKDIVKAAEKCTSGCIHPGTPWNPNEPGLEKLIKRAEKYQ